MEVEDLIASLKEFKLNESATDWFDVQDADSEKQKQQFVQSLNDDIVKQLKLFFIGTCEQFTSVIVKLWKWKINYWKWTSKSYPFKLGLRLSEKT